MYSRQSTTTPLLSEEANLPQKLMVNFYRYTIESILTNCMTAWYSSCAKAAQKALQQVVKTAQIIIGTNLPSLDHLYRWRANTIIKDITHPNYSLFQLLPSERRFQSIRVRTNRLKNCFYPTASFWWTLVSSACSCKVIYDCNVCPLFFWIIIVALWTIILCICFVNYLYCFIFNAPWGCHKRNFVVFHNDNKVLEQTTQKGC